MALRDEPARRVHDPLAAVGDGARLDQIAALPFGTEAEALVRDELVGRFLTKSSDVRIAAPAPSDVGQHWSFVSGSKTIAAFLMSSSEYSCWNCEYGLLTECFHQRMPLAEMLIGRGQ
jgi:hypothetical protein